MWNSKITYANERTIPVGITIEDIDVGEMTYDEAMKAVNSFIAQYTDRVFELDVDGKKVTVTAGELGYYWKNTDIVKKASSYCRQGNVIQRYKEAKDIEAEGVSLEIQLQVDDEILLKTINEKCAIYNIPHVNARLTKSGDSFSISQESTGRMIDMDKSIADIHDYLLNSWDGKDGSYTLTVVDDYPISTVEDCKRVNAILGSFSTSFSIGGGNYNRNMNMSNGMNLLNGITLCPGEVFSANKLLEPWTAANGWKPAGTYVNGKVEDSLGGGICQVSTTLYNAVINAELNIVQRFNHSMSVGYVPLSMDAALAGTWKDLRFSNNYEIPIYIEAIYDASGKLTFNIYGEETRPENRKVEYVSETTGTIASKEIVTQSASYPNGYRKVTSRGQTGYTAQLWKKVYVNGVLQSEEVINKSSYISTPTYVTVGIGGEPPAEPDPDPQTDPINQPEIEPETQPQTQPPTEPPTEAETTERKTEKPKNENSTTKKQDDTTKKHSDN